jgi:hypothetical protein
VEYNFSLIKVDWLNACIALRVVGAGHLHDLNIGKHVSLHPFYSIYKSFKALSKLILEKQADFVSRAKELSI